MAIYKLTLGNNKTIDINPNQVTSIRVVEFDEKDFGIIVTVMPGTNLRAKVGELSFETKLEAETATELLVSELNELIGTGGGGSQDLSEYVKNDNPKLQAIELEGDGTKYLSNDGTYKEISGGGNNIKYYKKMLETTTEHVSATNFNFNLNHMYKVILNVKADFIANTSFNFVYEKSASDTIFLTNSGYSSALQHMDYEITIRDGITIEVAVSQRGLNESPEYIELPPGQYIYIIDYGLIEWEEDEL